MEPKAFFATIYQDAVRPVMVLDEQLKIQYHNAELLLICDLLGIEKEELLSDQALRAAKACLQELHGETILLGLPYGELSVMMVPSIYQEKRYLALYPERKVSSLQQEEQARILRNSYDRLMKYLNEMYSLIQAMEAESKEREELSNGVRRILRMANHLYQVMDREGIIEYRVPINMCHFLDSYLAQFNQLSSRCILAVLKPKDLYARIMPEDMEMILGTLLSNAIRFGGEDVAVRLMEDGDALILSVWDSGKGPAEPDRLFDWGYRTLDKKGKKGLGFSLPMAKLLAERQGAKLQYRRRDEGSSFEIVMKRDEAPAATLAEWQGEPMENSLSQLRIEMSDI